ncbi:MAG: hypothetical protein VW378_04790 [bacterium]
MSKKYFFLIILSIWVTPHITAFTLNYNVSPNIISLGSPFKAQILIKSAKPIEIQKGLSAKDFEPLHLLKQTLTQEKSLKTISYTLQRFRKEQTMIPTLNLQILHEKTLHNIIIPAYPLGLKSNFKKDELKNPTLGKNKANIEFSFLWRWLLLPFSGILCALICGILIYRWYKNKKNNLSQNLPQKIYISPVDQALEALENLKKKNLLTNEKIKEHYSELSDIIKQFLSRQYSKDLSEKTSRECLYSLRETLEEHAKRKLKNLFNSCDLVKFAKHRPNNKTHEDILEKSKQLICKLAEQTQEKQHDLC